MYFEKKRGEVMLIDMEKCVGCGSCMPYCPVAAIRLEDSLAEIDLDECVECSDCKRSNVCPTDAIYQQELKWPRTIRSILSDVFTISVESGVSGRGTEEMKTNDVTGRFKKGYVGIAVEMGRPILGTRFYDVEMVTMALSKLGGIEYEKANPVTSLISEKATGKFRDDVLNEKVYSAIIEFSVPIERVGEVLDTLKDVSNKIETVFSLDICSKVNEDNTIPSEEAVRKIGYYISSNGKTNVGLGRPLKEEDK